MPFFKSNLVTQNSITLHFNCPGPAFLVFWNLNWFVTLVTIYGLLEAEVITWKAVLTGIGRYVSLGRVSLSAAVGVLQKVAQRPAEVPEMAQRVRRCAEAVLAVAVGNSNLFEGEQQQPLLPACTSPARDHRKVAFTKLFADCIDVVGIPQGEGLINGAIGGVDPSFGIVLKGLNPFTQGNHGIHHRCLERLFDLFKLHNQNPPTAKRSSQAPS